MILNPYFWGAIALALLLSFFGGCQVQKGRDADRWDQHLAADKAADDVRKAENEDYRAREKADKMAIKDARKAHDKAISDGKQTADHLRRDLLARPERVRDHWRTGKCDVSKDPAADRRGKSDSELQAEDLATVSEVGSEADARVTFLLSRYAQAEKVCGTIQN